MGISEMRKFIISRYPDSESWKTKVSKMPDNQVVAIYHNMIKRKQEPKTRNSDKKKPEFHQITIIEYLTSINNSEEVL